MKASKGGAVVWVPCEECDSGLLVTDQKNGNELFVPGGDVRSKEGLSRFGRKVKRLTIRGVMVGTEGEFDLVSFPGVPKAAVHVRKVEPEAGATALDHIVSSADEAA